MSAASLLFIVFYGKEFEFYPTIGSDSARSGLPAGAAEQMEDNTAGLSAGFCQQCGHYQNDDA